MLSSRIRPLAHRQITTQPRQSTSLPALTTASSLPDSSLVADQESADDEADDADVESLLSSFLPHLFPDDTPVCLGDPGQTLVYSSSQFGDLNVWVPDYGSAEKEEGDESRKTHQRVDGANVEAGRRLFAHYLWGGALVIADEIERRYRVSREGLSEERESSLGNVREEELWDVNGEDVLELGAGAGLPSIIALRCGAKSVSITDHPSAKGLYGPIQQSLAASLPSSLHQNVSIHPYTWGTFPETNAKPASNSSINKVLTLEKELNFAISRKSKYTRIICADCLWMPEQHDNLAKSIAWFLAPPPLTATFSKRRAAELQEVEQGSSTSSAAAAAAAYVVAGFHTGRDVVASFFENAVSKAGLLVERIYERDLHAKVEDGRVTREWKPDRPGESDRSRWCVVAFLRRRQSVSSH
ncbi:hypothetical protein KEM54_001775 [Ascosphaera aggregata]|nr:hypothetical protein KEM54_001775 [Ascosphaera aggregata]